MHKQSSWRRIGPLLACGIVLMAARALYAQDAATPPASEPAVAAPAAAAATASAPAADVPVEISDKKLAELWDDLLHYIYMGRADLVRSYAQAILKKDPKPQDLYQLSITYKPGLATPMETLTKGGKLEGAADLMTQIMKKIEAGYEANLKDPQQIDRSIEALAGNLQAFDNASKRLVTSGEYALPQMIQKLGDEKTSTVLKERLAAVLKSMGKTAVNGLVEVLAAPNPELQETVANVLGQSGYRQAAPYLKALSQQKGLLERTRKTVDSALTKLVGPGGDKKSVAELAYEQALRFYNQDQSLQCDPRFPTGNVWYWDEGRLSYRPVPREIFADVYAMRLAKMAMTNDPKHYRAMALWLAVNFKREADLPAGAKDPTLPPNMPAARFFALASPPEILQDVLALGMKDKNDAIALGAMEALVRTQGAKSLVKPVGDGTQPLVEALSYPGRQVRFLAAISLANALPEARFNGSEIVVNVLNDALRLTGKKTALLVTADQKQTNAVKDAIRAAQYDVVEQGSASAAVAAAKANPAIDVVVVADAGEVEATVSGLRREVSLTAMPVVGIAEGGAVLTELAKNDQRLTIVPSVDKVAASLATLAKQGDLSAEQATQWMIRAAQSARLLGETGNTVYDLNRLRPSLIAAKDNANFDVAIAAARALAVQSAADAQQAIVTLAFKPALSEKQVIEALGVLTESVRRHGNQLTEAQVQSLGQLVSANGPEPVRQAAAQAWGSLNLPSEKSMSLILKF